jgi:hypothetical protein
MVKGTADSVIDGEAIYTGWSTEIWDFGDDSDYPMLIGLPGQERTTPSLFMMRIPVTFEVTVTAVNGRVTGAGSYETGAQVILEAIPDEGYEFFNWTDEEGAAVSSENPYIFTMPEAGVHLVANFAATDELDISPLEMAIAAAQAAKAGVAVSEDGTDLPAGTCWVTQGDMEALEAAMATAELQWQRLRPGRMLPLLQRNFMQL